MIASVLLLLFGLIVVSCSESRQGAWAGAAIAVIGAGGIVVYALGLTT